MKIKIEKVIPYITERYPYTHRVEVLAQSDEHIEGITDWLNQNNLDHVSMSWGVYYVGPQTASWLLLRWS